MVTRGLNNVVGVFALVTSLSAPKTGALSFKSFAIRVTADSTLRLAVC